MITSSRTSAQNLRLLVPPSVVYFPAVGGLVGWALWQELPVLHGSLAVLLGLVAWTLAEYAIHRWIQHGPPTARWVFLMDDHYHHHQYPNDVEELVYPLWRSVWLIPVTGGLFWGASQSLLWAACLEAGFLLGYLAYEWLHMCSHTPQLSKDRPWLQRLMRNHYLHHTRRRRGNYGFITDIWDRVFRTL